MREIGGYIEFEHFHGPMLHEGMIALNCGRSCLRYLIRARNIRKIVLPVYCASSVRGACRSESVGIRYFLVGKDWMPKDVTLAEDEWLYLVNYYGQLTQEKIRATKERYGRIIVDNAEAYYDEPVDDVDTLYTCRKFYGVADGGLLATDAPRPSEHFARDESYERMHFLLGRFERTASEFYTEYAKNNDFLAGEDIKRMSRLTENLLRGVDDAAACARRTENFERLAEAFRDVNGLGLHTPVGAFAYPLLVPHGAEVRRKLIAEKIYIPTLWPNVLTEAKPGSWDYTLAQDVLPLPVDQRYGAEDMAYLIARVKACIHSEEAGK